MKDIKAIPTEYNRILFRSRLEATWAAVFDHYGISWVYEPEGYRLSDGTLYNPDFYLPDSDSIFEVKGVMTEKDRHKIVQWVQDCNRPAAIGFVDGRFEACDMGWDGKWQFDENPFLNKCSNCGKLSFMAMGNGQWLCPCCNKSEGDHWLNALTEGRIADFEAFRPRYANPNWR